ncbi:MAG: aminotransferase class I/II-fold pyridoxal phosphate-dependent enzyme [Flavobacteriales bacterium]|nr:aminotransferase class I/II-fold pyridoxal phosphate-dependent enzyme [Flavobacteriales bacterium]
MSLHLKSKLPNVGTTIFTEMSLLANSNNAINLSQGFPDFECSPEIKEAIHKAVQENHNQYAPMQGILALRERISEKTSGLYGRTYKPESEITVVPGATIAIFTAILCCVQPGDEVIVIEPAYDCYVPAIELAGGKAVFSSLQLPDFSINWQEIKKLINDRTRLILINSPQNPGTSVISSSDVDQLNELTRGTEIFVLSDEVYEHMVFDGKQHHSLAAHEELSERSFIVSSFGKTYHVTGWKTGYVLAPEFMTREFRKVYQYNAFCTFTPAQFAFNEMLKDESSYLQVSPFYERKRDHFQSLIKNSSFKIIPCSGSYFQLVDFSSISTDPEIVFAKKLTTRFKIAGIPLSSFYHNKKDQHLLRFCFAKKDKTLEMAAEILNTISKENYEE